MVMINPADYVLWYREVSAGVWFMLGTTLALVFFHYAAVRMQRARWYRDVTVCAALALGIYLSGSAVRIGTSWGSIIAIRDGKDIGPYLATPWYSTSVVLSVVGAAWAIWIFSSDRTRIPVTIVAIALAVLVPVAVAVWA